MKNEVMNISVHKIAWSDRKVIIISFLLTSILYLLWSLNYSIGYGTSRESFYHRVKMELEGPVYRDGEYTYKSIQNMQKNDKDIIQKLNKLILHNRDQIIYFDDCYLVVTEHKKIGLSILLVPADGSKNALFYPHYLSGCIYYPSAY
jgi:hypothetical protein